MSKRLSSRIKSKLDRLLANTGDMALKRRAKRIIEELNPQDGDKILDVGCGDGYYLYLLSNLGLKLRLVGTDFDPRALESARKNLKGKRILLIKANLMKRLPFANNSFDKVVMSEVVEHLPDDAKGLKEVYRILKLGGVLCLSVPNANYPFLWDPVNWVSEHLFGTHIKSGFWAGIWSQHLRLYKPEEIEKVIEGAGFKVLATQSFTFWCLPFNHYLINLGARCLASKSNLTLIKGASKFSTNTSRSFITNTFFLISQLIDQLNTLLPIKNQGVSIVLKATK